MSIKKKFATAVATASLLAGLFGSAFVPSAMGAIVVGADAVFKPSYTTVTTWNKDAGNGNNAYMAQAGTSKVFGFQSDWAYVGSGDFETAIGIGLKKSDNTALDLSDAAFDDLQLKAVSSNTAVKLRWAYANDGTELSCSNDEVEDNLVNSSTFVDVAAHDMENIDGDTDDLYWLCFGGRLPTTAATSTITVTVGGVTATTFTMTAVGPIETVNVALNISKYVAADNNQVDDWATVTAKDAAGTVINGSSNSISPMDSTSLWIDDDGDQVENESGTQIDAADGSPYLLSDGATYVTYNQMYLEENNADDVCNATDAFGENGDEGKSYGLKFNVWNDDNSLNDDSEEYTDTNVVTITCTGGLDGARVTKVTPEATAGGTDYEETGALDDGLLELVATIVDADGAPLGEGTNPIDDSDGSEDGFDLGLSFTGSTDLNFDVEGDGEDDTFVIGGEAVLGTLLPTGAKPGGNTYKVTYANSDLAVYNADDEEVAKVFTLKYTAEFAGYDGDIAKSRNAAKTTATVVADFGEYGEFGKIQFVIQNANGAQRFVVLNAGADGAATLVFSRRNQRVSVTAYLQEYGTAGYNSGETDTISIRFR